MPPSNAIWDAAIAGGFVLGLVLFIISSAMLRASKPEAVAQRVSRRVTWTRLVDDELKNADTALRTDMIERLGMVPGAWSRDILTQAKREERDPQILAAIDDALRRV